MASIDLGAHRVVLHVAECHLVGLVQVVSAVHLALKAGLLPDRVLWTKLWGDHPQHWGGTVREDKRLENRPARVQAGWVDRDRSRKERNQDSETPINPEWRQSTGAQKERNTVRLQQRVILVVDQL